LDTKVRHEGRRETAAREKAEKEEIESLETDMWRDDSLER
jgi:hypothetical protein